MDEVELLSTRVYYQRFRFHLQLVGKGSLRLTAQSSPHDGTPERVLASSTLGVWVLDKTYTGRREAVATALQSMFGQLLTEDLIDWTVGLLDTFQAQMATKNVASL